MNTKKRIKFIYNTIVVLLLAVFLVYIGSRFIHPGSGEYTDDAQIRRNVIPVNTRIQGFITRICYNEYEQVHKGDTLFIIDNSEYVLRLAQAEADLSNTLSASSVTSAGVKTAQNNVQVASSGIEEAKITMDNAERDYLRYAELLKKEAITRQQYDHQLTLYKAAKARYEQLSRQKVSTALAGNEQSKRLGQNAAAVRLAKAAVALAHLNLSYTVIVAPCNGVMGRKDIHEGQLVQPGQTLTSIVDINSVWVIANFRETQMKHINTGQAVAIKVDAVGSEVYNGVVEAISEATGASYSGIPEDNATGNFVKVEQRVPVRIKLVGNKNADIKKLRAGLNVECSVRP